MTDVNYWSYLWETGKILLSATFALILKYFYDSSTLTSKNKLSIHPKNNVGLLIVNNTGNSGNLQSIKIRNCKPIEINFSIPSGNDEKKNLLEYEFLLNKLCTDIDIKAMIMSQQYEYLKKSDFFININNKKLKISFDSLLIPENVLIKYKLDYLKKLAKDKKLGNELHELLNFFNTLRKNNFYNTVGEDLGYIKFSNDYQYKFFEENKLTFNIVCNSQYVPTDYDQFLNEDFFKNEVENPYSDDLTFINLRTFFEKNRNNFETDLYYLLYSEYFYKGDDVEHRFIYKDYLNRNEETTVCKKFYKQLILILCIILFPELISQFKQIDDLIYSIIHQQKDLFLKYTENTKGRKKFKDSLLEDFLLEIYEILHPVLYKNREKYKDALLERL